MAKPKYSIILPTFNERENIAHLIKDFFSLLGEETEVIVVDDDSPDLTWQVVEEMTAAYPRLRLIRRQNNRGLVPSLREGIAASKGEIIIWMDADGSMPVTKVPELIKGISEGYDLVAGSRFVPQGGVELVWGGPDSMAAFFLSLTLNRWCQFWLGSWFHDFTSGFVAVRKSILEKIQLRGDYGEYFISLVYEVHRLKFRLLEVPYIKRARCHGQSKTGLTFSDYLRRGWKYLWLTLRLKLIS